MNENTRQKIAGGAFCGMMVACLLVDAGIVWPMALCAIVMASALLL